LVSADNTNTQVILILKYYLYKYRCLGDKPSINGSTKYLKYYIKIEKHYLYLKITVILCYYLYLKITVILCYYLYLRINLIGHYMYFRNYCQFSVPLKYESNSTKYLKYCIKIEKITIHFLFLTQKEYICKKLLPFGSFLGV
jgi:hypothetical protein